MDSLALFILRRAKVSKKWVRRTRRRYCESDILVLEGINKLHQGYRVMLRETET
jgi:hypothetical protein